MSNPDDPERTPQSRPTEAWDPDDLPFGEAGDEGEAAAGDDPGEEPAEPAPDGEAAEGDGEGTGDPGDEPPGEGTRVISPEMVEELREAAAREGDADEEPAPGGAPSDESGPDPLVGQLIRDKWRVLSRLGAGSYGTVYKVRDEMGGWIEALKILGVDRITGAEAETVRMRFLREAQIMKRLGNQSQHIVGLSTYEEDLEAGLVYFLMEFVEGRPLSDVLAEEGPFDAERVVALALQVCDGLEVAHEGPEGVVHRDLKLENVMLTRDQAGHEIAKILDFGIAKLAEREPDSRLTAAGTLGTPGYAAPEQLRAEEVDGRTDLFALGVILYSLLTGKDPWLGNPATEPTNQIYELMVATERGDVTPMPLTGVQVPPALEGVVMRLLRRNPDDRYPSARALREALERVAAGGADADVASLRILTEPEGVEVEVRAGRRMAAEGVTPLVANLLEPGRYRVVVRDERFERVETPVSLEPGAMEDVTLVTRPRSEGLFAGVRRRPGLTAAAVLLLLAGAVAAVLQPWGRTLTPAELQDRVASVRWVQVTEDGLRGALGVAGVAVPFTTPLEPDRRPAAVAALRDAGVTVDVSWEVARLIDEAAAAQERLDYFGPGPDDVESQALRAAALAPDDPRARALLRKVAERMSWDAEAALADADTARAGELAEACARLVPDYPRCPAITAR